MATNVPHDSPYRLQIDELGVDCPLLKLEGQDKLNETPRYEVVAAAPSGADLGSWLGRRASVQLGTPDLKRHGLLVGCGHLDQRSGEHEVVRCLVQPRLWRLSKRRQSRVFQDSTAVEIISTMLDEHHVPHVTRLAEQYRPLSYRVQYRETDLSLLERLAGDHGLFWFVAELNGADIVVLGDSPAAYEEIGEPKHLRRHEEGALRDVSPSYSRFAWDHALEATAVHVRHHDVNRSGQGIDGTARLDEERGLLTSLSHNGWREAAADPGRLLEYDHIQDYGLADDAQHVAKVRTEQLRRDTHRGLGRTFDTRAASGTMLQLEDHAVEDPLVLTAVLHRYRWQGDGDNHAYDNEVAATPAKVAYRALPPPRREAPSVELATVVAPETNAGLHTDELGRVRVSFHWNRADATESNSCWLRVVQPWAGPGWGSVFVPRDGMEVAVGFAGGDIDSPIVLGALYNGQNRPPFDPRTRQSGFRSSGLGTNQEQAGGGSEVLFDDTYGTSRMILRTEGSLEEHATVSVTRRVQGPESHAVTDAYDLLVGGAGMWRTGEAMTIAVGGDSLTTVRGSTTRRHEQSLTEQVDGSAQLSATEQLALSTAGRMDLQSGSLSLMAGNPDQPGNIAMDAMGEVSIHSSQTLLVHAGQELRLQCGKAAIVLSEDAIRLVAPRVVVGAEEETLIGGGGASMALDGGLSVAAGEVVLSSVGASLALDTNASLDGSLVLLNCGGSSAGGASEALPERETVPLHVILLQRDGLPFSGWKYRLSASGSVLTGKLDALGNLVEEIPAGADYAQIQLTREGSEEVHIFQVEVGDLPPLLTTKGLKIRLRNLGFYVSNNISDEVDEALIHAIQQFQLSLGFAVGLADELVDEEGSVTLDDQTRMALMTQGGSDRE